MEILEATGKNHPENDSQMERILQNTSIETQTGIYRHLQYLVKGRWRREKREAANVKEYQEKRICGGSQEKQLSQRLRPREWASVLMETSQAEADNYSKLNEKGEEAEASFLHVLRSISAFLMFRSNLKVDYL